MPVRRLAFTAAFLVFAGCSRSPSVLAPSPVPDPSPAPAPVISHTFPREGFPGATLTIAGSGFLPGASVTIGGVTMFFGLLRPGLIVVSAPTSVSGTVDVVVTNPDGQTATAAASFTYATGTLTVAPGSVAPGGELAVSWTTTLSEPRHMEAWDWVGLFGVGALNEHYLGYQYTVPGSTSGTQTWKAPDEPGQYEFRYLPNDGYVDAFRSGPFTVAGPPPGADTSTRSTSRQGGRGGRAASRPLR